MLRMSLLVAAAAALAVPAGIAAQNASVPTQVATPKPKAEDDASSRIICRRVEVSGSLVKRGKVCKPAKEWNQIVSDGNDTARAVIESGRACAGGPLCNPNGV